MSSHTAAVQGRRVLIPVFVLEAESQPDGPLGDRLYTALVDTGTTTSMISQQVVQQHRVAVLGTDNFMPATGVLTETTLHRVALAVPTSTVPEEEGGGTTFIIRDSLSVLKMPKPLEGFDVVIGMDVLMHFHLRMSNRVFTISSEPL